MLDFGRRSKEEMVDILARLKEMVEHAIEKKDFWQCVVLLDKDNLPDVELLNENGIMHYD